MDLEFLTKYDMPLVMAACLIIGYLIKKTLNVIPNKYIPLILAITGAILGCCTQKSFSLENIVCGAMTGLASTGMHQSFTRLIEKNEDFEND